MLRLCSCMWQHFSLSSQHQISNVGMLFSKDPFLPVHISILAASVYSSEVLHTGNIKQRSSQLYGDISRGFLWRNNSLRMHCFLFWRSTTTHFIRHEIGRSWSSTKQHYIVLTYYERYKVVCEVDICHERQKNWHNLKCRYLTDRLDKSNLSLIRKYWCKVTCCPTLRWSHTRANLFWVKRVNHCKKKFCKNYLLIWVIDILYSFDILICSVNALFFIALIPNAFDKWK